MLVEPANMAAMRCVFGCDSPVVGIFWTPQGSFYHCDQTQALCQAHATSVQSTGPITCVIDLKKYLSEALA